jgi:hypothetical protein
VISGDTEGWLDVITGHGRKITARNGRNDMRLVRGNKELARARQCLGKVSVD